MVLGFAVVGQAVPWSFSSPLNAGAWMVLAAVPLGIVLLYFLKLRRRPVLVPSTMLWKRSLEDLHVNSLFQRLRRSLLLMLQLAFVGLLLLALTGPRVQGLARQGQRLVLAIDESASMGARDGDPGPTRLDEAKAEARKVIEAMEPGDLAMIVAFGTEARVVVQYTADKGLLRRQLDSIVATDSGTSLREVLELVAGLANPQKYLEPGEGVVASEVVAPRLFLFTDGGFADVPGFSLGNIQPEVVAVGPPPRAPGSGDRGGAGSDPAGDPEGMAGIGTDGTEAGSGIVPIPSDNVAILALSAARRAETPEEVQLLGRVRNYRDQPVVCRAALLSRAPGRPGLPDTLIDAVELELAPRSDQSFQFDLGSSETEAQYMVRLDVEDALPLDNTAYLVIGQPRRTRVLLVGTGNRFLADTLDTEAVRPLAEVTNIAEERLSDPDIERELAAGEYDLVIYDGVAGKRVPQANTLSFGVLPPGTDAGRARPVEAPLVLDWDTAHPLLQYVRDFAGIGIRRGLVLEPPTGARVLIESDQGPLAYAATRSGFVDVCVGFGLIEGQEFNTNWPLRTGFPLFIYNCLRVLGSAQEGRGIESYRAGATILLKPTIPGDRLEIFDLSGQRVETVERSAHGSFAVTRARRTGIYEAAWGPGPSERTAFAVNLFDPRESDLSTRGVVPPGVPDDEAERYLIRIGYNPVAARRIEAPTAQEGWWPLTLVALAIVLVEWYVYNRRVAV
ncbi:MAG: lipoprotein [Isosphaeraceae bacterium]|jgi:hypothetical protein|nr:MAG: lipoprotein [Isosphaeraceae bacterium]